MKKDIQSLVESSNAFALNLYSKLGATQGNLCISPFSIYTALAMTFAGARHVTEKQMKEVMEISLPQNKFHGDFARLLDEIGAGGQGDGIELLLANSIYPHNKYVFLESFLACLKENYDTIITPLDYNEPETARKSINQWVNEKTQEHISKLIPTNILDPLTRLVLVNAIYFKGLWKKQFDKQATIESPFWILNDSAIKVPMMRQKSEFGYMEDELAQVLELPYQGDHLSLIIILPQEKLSADESRLTYHNISKWISALSYEMVDVNLPSFKIKSTFNLNDSLVSMGMPDAFDDSKADFSGMDGTRELYISNTIHQANIDVNEEGATATAATAVVMSKRSLPQDYQFHANHPFIFLLRENTTGSIMFIGRVLNPAG